jgi:hypothetical protein
MSTVNHAPVGSDPTSVVPVSNASSSSAPKLICSFIYVRIEGHLSRWVPSPTTPRGSEIITGPPTKLFFLPPGIRDCIGDSLPVFHDSIGYFCLSCTSSAPSYPTRNTHGSTKLPYPPSTQESSACVSPNLKGSGTSSGAFFRKIRKHHARLDTLGGTD